MKLDLCVGGYIINGNKVLLVHHKFLGMWLPVGGHIDKDETPDDALIREVKEELNLDVEILNNQDLPVNGKIKRNLANPFYVNVHNVGDHDHCGFFYICKVKDISILKIEKKELNDFNWFTKEDLIKKDISEDVKNQAMKALELFKKF